MTTSFYPGGPGSPPAFMAPQGSDNVGGAHTTVVSIGVILLVTIILVELAGTSHTIAIGVAILLVAVLAIAGMTHQGRLSQFTSKYPAVP